MNYFELLPDELIVAHCEELDAISLAKLSHAYARVYYVCRDILERKRREYNIKKFMDEFNSVTSTMNINERNSLISRLHNVHLSRSMAYFPE